MNPISILFPSSYPNSHAKLEQSKKALAPYQETFTFDWPRVIRIRQSSDVKDYLAGSDEERCSEIVNFLASATGTAWFGRGGYGLTRLLPLLAERLAGWNPPAPKRWMGYSDITALFALCKVLSLPVECIHGPMLCAFSEQPNKEELLGALRGEASPIPFSSVSSDLQFRGPVWGGNLAVLASLSGTPWLPVPEAGTAVFLEDVDEAPYRVDRYLTQLSQSGFFKHTNKVVLGTFTGFEPATAVLEVASQRCSELGLEVLGTVPVGHSEPHSPLFLDKPYFYSRADGLLLPNFDSSPN